MLIPEVEQQYVTPLTVALMLAEAQESPDPGARQSGGLLGGENGRGEMG